MLTRIQFDDLPLPVLTVALELPVSFEALPVDEQRQLVERGMVKAHETAQRILDRRRVHAA